MIRPEFGSTESCGKEVTEDNPSQSEKGVLLLIEAAIRVALLNDKWLFGNGKGVQCNNVKMGQKSQEIDSS